MTRFEREHVELGYDDLGDKNLKILAASNLDPFSRGGVHTYLTMRYNSWPEIPPTSLFVSASGFHNIRVAGEVQSTQSRI